MAAATSTSPAPSSTAVTAACPTAAVAPTSTASPAACSPARYRELLVAPHLLSFGLCFTMSLGSSENRKGNFVGVRNCCCEVAFVCKGGGGSQLLEWFFCRMGHCVANQISNE